MSKILVSEDVDAAYFEKSVYICLSVPHGARLVDEFDSMAEAVEGAIERAHSLRAGLHLEDVDIQIEVRGFPLEVLRDGRGFPCGIVGHEPYDLSGQDLSTLREWAKEFDGQQPECDYCGKSCYSKFRNLSSDWTALVFCSEYCAEMDWINEDDGEPEKTEGVPEDLDDFLRIVETVFGDECVYRTSEDEDEFEWEWVRGWRNSLTISCLRYKLEWVVSDNAVRGQGETFEDAAREYLVACGVDPERAAAVAAGDFGGDDDVEDDDDLEEE